jgi:phage shock protein PspC (stress-responsive transcriptional regulator)
MSTDTAATIPDHTDRTDRTDHTDDASLDGARAWFAQHGLTRPRDGRVIGGVTAAFSRRYRVNRLVARVIAVGIAVILTPAIYVALWVLMPSEA